MTRLIHLNGPPGVGKSTIAEAYVAEHPGVLNCDVDVLRTLIGGWESDFVGAGNLIRPAALAMVTAYLRHSQDVVLPQMLLDLAELERFQAAAHDAGAELVEVMLMSERTSVVDRFHRRGDEATASAWHDQVRAIVAADGGDATLLRCHDRLVDLLERRPDTRVIDSNEGSIEETYRSVTSAVHCLRGC